MVAARTIRTDWPQLTGKGRKHSFSLRKTGLRYGFVCKLNCDLFL